MGASERYHQTPSLLLMQVAVYVDGVRVGVAPASGETPHHIIHRLCELDLARSELEQPPQQVGVGFRLRLPDLQQGRHEVRPHCGSRHCHYLLRTLACVCPTCSRAARRC